jgi:hypothetical protein
MKHAKPKTAYKRVMVAAILAVGLIASLFGVVATANNRVAAPTQQVLGRVETCQLNASSKCVINHGLGVKPTAVVTTPAGPGQNITIDVTQITATSYTVLALWHDGKRFTTKPTIKFNAVYTYVGEAVEPTPTPTTPTASPTQSPTATPPTTTTPTVPPTSTPGNYDCNPASGVKAHFYPRNGGQGEGSDALGDAQAPEKWGQYNVSAEHWAVKDDYLSNLCAYSTKNFYVDIKATDDGDHSVQAYPSMRKIYHDWGNGGDFSDNPKLSTFPQLKASVAVTDPANCTGCKYNDAFDIWLNGIGGNKPELMIWTHNHGQTPYGPKVASNITIDGRQWDYYRSGNYFAYVPVGNANIPSGTYDLKAFINDVVSRGHLPENPAVSQVSYGVEPVHTGGVFKRWHFTDFTIVDY